MEFTVLGVQGRMGPTSDAVSQYDGTPLEGQVTIGSGSSFPDERGYQQWTVPVTGTYRLEAVGAAGGSYEGNENGGGGAMMKGDFAPTAGDVLVIVVGQLPGNGGSEGHRTTQCGNLGGGGTFIALSNGDPLLVAGAGSGSHGGSNGHGGVIEEDASSSFSYAGTDGQGGTSTQTGAGHYSDCDTLSCAGTSYYSEWPQSFMDGGAIGGYYSGTDSYGDFGGGAGGHSGGGMSGGGGYSGGGSDGEQPFFPQAASIVRH